MVVPRIPKLNEYLAVMSDTAWPRSRRKSRSSSRVCCSSRMSPAISSLGASALVTASKRTWSLPAPVEPWAMTSAPRSSATRVTSSAWSIRSTPTHDG